MKIIYIRIIALFNLPALIAINDKAVVPLSASKILYMHMHTYVHMLVCMCVVSASEETQL